MSEPPRERTSCIGYVGVGSSGDRSADEFESKCVVSGLSGLSGPLGPWTSAKECKRVRKLASKCERVRAIVKECDTLRVSARECERMCVYMYMCVCVDICTLHSVASDVNISDYREVAKE